MLAWKESNMYFSLIAKSLPNCYFKRKKTQPNCHLFFFKHINRKAQLMLVGLSVCAQRWGKVVRKTSENIEMCANVPFLATFLFVFAPEDGCVDYLFFLF